MAGQTNSAVQIDTIKTTSSNRWIIIFTALAVVGAICWGLQLTQGLQVTNLGVYNMWGLYIIGFIIFTGVAGGSLLLASARIAASFHWDDRNTPVGQSPRHSPHPKQLLASKYT